MGVLLGIEFLSCNSVERSYLSRVGMARGGREMLVRWVPGSMNSQVAKVGEDESEDEDADGDRGIREG